MRYDYCVIGGGIVGLSTAMAILRQRPGASVLLLEKEDGLASHQTGHNSGVIHAGIYYTPGSLKATLCREGNRATKAFCDEAGVPYETCGKLVVATDPMELARLEELQARASANGIAVQRFSADALSELEPEIVGTGALLVPSTGIVDYRQVAEAMAARVKQAGGDIRLSVGVASIKESVGEVSIAAEEGTWCAERLVVCAGQQSDRLARLAGLKVDFRIVPFRGEYFLLPPERYSLVKHLIYPVPDPALPFLGIHLTRMIDGRVTVGPNAVLGLAREKYASIFSTSPSDVADYLRFVGFWRMVASHWRSGLGELRRSLLRKDYLAECRKYAPSLTVADLLPYPAGIRAQAVMSDGSLVHDFLLLQTDRMLHVCNAPSPAATSAIPIGRMISETLHNGT